MKPARTPPEDAKIWFRHAAERQQHQLRQARHRGEWATHIAHLVHHLQRERGTSNIWLCSKGALFLAELDNCARQVDAQVRQFKTLLTPDPSLTPTQCGCIARALWALDELPALRRNVASGAIGPDQVMAWFCHMIRQLLTIIPETISALDAPAITRVIAALYSFMQGKELAGQERAIGAIGFTRGAFDAPLRQQLVEIIESQQQYFETYNSLVHSGSDRDWPPVPLPAREVEQLRREACTRPSHAVDPNPALI